MVATPEPDHIDGERQSSDRASSTLVVGLTGGIASGKSRVSAQLVRLGAALVDADQVAREVVAPGSIGLQAVIERFGAALLLPSGELDRKALGDIVFADPEALRQLEALLHPRIRARIRERVATLRATHPPVILVDAALLVELGLHLHCDVVVVVHCGVEVQLARLMARDGLTEAAARQRIAAQTDDLTRLSAADHAIDNQGSLQELEASVTRVWMLLTSREAGDDRTT